MIANDINLFDVLRASARATAGQRALIVEPFPCIHFARAHLKSAEVLAVDGKPTKPPARISARQESR